MDKASKNGGEDARSDEKDVAEKQDISMDPESQSQDLPPSDPSPSQSRMGRRLAPLKNGARLAWNRTMRILRWLSNVNLSIWIIAGAILGIVLGVTAPKFSVEIKPLSNAFLYMIQCLITPLIFSTLVIGVTGHGDDLLGVGRLALKSIVYFEIITTFALIIGLIMVNIAKPGRGMSVQGDEGAPDLESKPITWYGELYKIIPQSFFKAASDNEVLQIVFCALMFAVAIIRTPSRQHRRVMNNFLKSLSAIMFKVTALVMNYAPIGICAALASTVGKNGLKVLVNLGKLIGTLLGTLLIFIAVILVPVMFICKIPMVKFLKTIGQPFLIAFTTASSESALPIAMENLEKMGIPKQIVGFVLPLGYSFNLDGTSLYLSLAAVFCAQASKIDLPLSKQIVMMLTLMLTSKGVAAVPRASSVVLASCLTNFDIPLETLNLILAVDAFADMMRTSVNLLGNCLAAVVMARWEGEYPPYGRYTGHWAEKDPNRVLPLTNSDRNDDGDDDDDDGDDRDNENSHSTERYGHEEGHQHTHGTSDDIIAIKSEKVMTYKTLTSEWDDDSKPTQEKT
ncbi:hypothetical protein H4219_003488 [Mycoemilia scoparia]|uniref:Amino acid transporter n=1 Tax=Mycoemilia scoparia TaxID=417184 RepID=A0A9W8DP70_9FUNG|nr:hypothetical protein H4219_003488 [Mycoemilia scoparia]